MAPIAPVIQYPAGAYGRRSTKQTGMPACEGRDSVRNDLDNAKKQGFGRTLERSVLRSHQGPLTSE